MASWQVIVFLIGTMGLLYISRQSLRNPRSHGFYRFFAWELVLALLLLNIPHWFEDPLAWHQVISWFLLFASLVPLFLGIRALRLRGRPDARARAEPELMAFERTTKLVTEGVYHYIRHPLYSSLFLLSWGLFFKRPSWAGAVLVLCASLFLFATAKADETECIVTFGAEYRQYIQRTRMFIPYIL